MSINQKGYTNRSNANRAAKAAKLAEFRIEPRDGRFFVVTPAQVDAATVVPTPVVAQVANVLDKPTTIKAIRKAATKPGKATVTKVAPTKPAAKPKAPKKPKGKLPKSSCGKGYKIEKQRPKAHGVVRNSKGTVGDVIWNTADKLCAKHGGDVSKVTRAMIVEACTPHGVNPTTAVLRFYLWRRFHGQRGRANLKKAAKPASKE